MGTRVNEKLCEYCRCHKLAWHVLFEVRSIAANLVALRSISVVPEVAQVQSLSLNSNRPPYQHFGAQIDHFDLEKSTFAALLPVRNSGTRYWEYINVTQVRPVTHRDLRSLKLKTEAPQGF